MQGWDEWVARWQQHRPRASAALLLAFGMERGVAPETLLAGTGLDVVSIHDGTNDLEAHQELRLAANLVDAIGRPGLGFEVGRRYHFGLHGVWSYAVLSSRSVGSALEVAGRYAELTYSFITPRAIIDGEFSRLELDTADIPPSLVPFFVERDLAAATMVCQALVGVAQFPVSGAHFAYAAPTDPGCLAEYETILGVEPTWSSTGTWLESPTALLDLPLEGMHSDAAAQGAIEACAELLARRRRRLGFSGEVRAALAQGRVTTDQAEVAARLCVSLRTLRRRLTEEGTTYRELAQETWGLLAEELLMSGLTVEQVAERLGYAGPSSFTRAFKSWKGTSPGSFARAKGARS